MILSCNNISKSFGTDVIIKSCSFNIEDHEKAAIVGINGAGKSTLLKIITGEEPADTGIVTLAKDKTLGYLAQQQDLQSDRSIYDELLSVKQYILDMESELRRIEAAMNSASGDELEALMNRYTNLNHEFEMNNGYAYKSDYYRTLGIHIVFAAIKIFSLYTVIVLLPEIRFKKRICRRRASEP